MKFFLFSMLIFMTPFAIYGIICTLVKIAEFRIEVLHQYKQRQPSKKLQGKKESENENG